ncbi:hypothetical protein N7501_010767 [Penicillium viridicatum]|nr:hypothetical protein N7501_010767 [Penicillium viridicatum]
MEIPAIQDLVAPTTPSSSVVEAMRASPPEVDRGYQNVDRRQEAKHQYNQHELKTAYVPVDLQEPEDHQETDKLKAPELLSDGHQDPKQQHNPDALKVRKPLLDDERAQRPYNIRITTALKALADNNTCLVEYGAQVQFRCGYEEGPVVVEWAVPDEQLSLASQILVENHFPRLFTGAKSWFGYWETGCLRHDLDGAGWMCMHLLPLSLVGLTLEDTSEPPRYMLSLIHHLRKLRIGDASRLRVEKDLLTFISSYILHGPPAHINPELLHRLVEQQSNEELLAKLEEGIKFIKKWDWGNVEETDLVLAERVVRDFRYVRELTDVAWDPTSPCTTPEPVSPVE